MCPRYEKEVVNAPKGSTEAEKYLEIQIPAIANRLASVLNISSGMLSQKLVVSMWKACLHEFSLSSNQNHWCAFFTQTELEMFEYYADLKRFYESGYGAPQLISTETACELMKDIVKLMDARVDHDQETLLEHASLRFAHAEVRRILSGFAFLELTVCIPP